MANKIALEFAQYVLQHNPKAKSFVAMYDAMSRVATFRSFRNLGREELARLGISFSLLATGKLERVIEEARKALSGHNDNNARGTRNLVAYGVGASSLVLRRETSSSSSKRGGLEAQPEGPKVPSNGIPLLPLAIQAHETGRFITD